MRLHRRQAGIELARRERADFIECARGNHGVEPCIDIAEKLIAIRHQKDFRGAGEIKARRLVFLVPIQNRAAGCQHHFERAGDARTVARHQPRRCRRIARGQFRMQRGNAFAGKPRAHVIANFCRDRRYGGEPTRERAKVKPGAADNDCRTRLLPRRREHRGGIRTPAARGIILGGIDVAVKPMRHAALLVGSRPRGDDPQVTIDLHGIGIDDLAAEFFGERQRQGRLAARRRACDQNDGGTAHGVDLMRFCAD